MSKLYEKMFSIFHYACGAKGSAGFALGIGMKIPVF